ncbi:MAG: ribosomal protein S18-alanine N-acetyltransferase [Armatimonadetes bacterium]|nr:ribosomal protein S18-alanine N-acetyltransferase [Armatimonadota bacterium]
MTRISIELMRMDHVPRVLTIERQSFPMPWPRDAYQHELKKNRLAAYLVAKTGEAVVGYAGMWLMLEEAHITTIAVDPDWRGQRIGEQLLVALFEEAMRRGARWMTLEVRRSNLVAQSLYRKYGFREVGARKGYYSDNQEDALIMWTGNLREPAFQERFQTLKDELDREDPGDRDLV